MASTATLKGASGKDYVFSFGTNALCRSEELTGLTLKALIDQLSQDPKVTVIRQFVQATLINPVALSAEQVGDAIDDLGGFDVVAAAFTPMKSSAPKVGTRAKRRRGPVAA